MKRFLCLLLTIVMLLSLCTVAFAQQETAAPVIVVSGMGSFPFKNAEGEDVYPPSGEAIAGLVTKNILPLTEFLFTQDWQKLGDEVIADIYEDIFSVIACDSRGNSINKISAYTFPESADNYPEYFRDSEKIVSETGIVKGLIDEIGGDKVYFFNYDWRLDPMAHADDLKEYVEKAKKEHNTDKVTLIPCSMGGTVVNSYLKKYGSDSLESIIYAMTAFQGINAVGEVMQRNISIDVSTLLESLFSMQKYNLSMQVLMGALVLLGEACPDVVKGIDGFIETSLSELNDRVYDELMLKTFGYFPGFWAMVPCSYYDEAKEIFFGGEISPEFEEIIDSYNYGVQLKAKELMTKAKAEGTDICILTSYGYMGGGYTDTARQQSDGVIEAANQSGFATFAEYGKVLGDDYKAGQCSVKDHSHLSADGIVDASTGFFPENTWFIKYNRHVGLPYGTDCQSLIAFLVSSDNATVFTNEAYPQFMSFNKITGELSEIKGPDSFGKSPLISGVFEIIKTLYYTIQSLINRG